METAFVTGGTGFVGANLVRLLLERGFRVRCLARKNGTRKNLEGLSVEIVEGDLSDTEALRIGCAGTKYVFHVAADYRIWVPDPAAMYAANVQGTVNVIEAAAQAGAEKIVYCSSVATIRPAADRRPVDESSKYSSVDEIVSHYKKSKFLGEKAAFDAAGRGAPVVIVNPAAPIGPFDIKPTPTGRIVLDFLNGRMPSYIDTGLNVVHAADVAEGHYLAALKGVVGQRYILGGENMTLKGMLDALGAETGLPAPRFQTPYAVAYLYGAFDSALSSLTGSEPRAPLDAIRMAKHYMWFDSGKARRELGYAPRPARQALKDAADWFVAHGYARAAAAA